MAAALSVERPNIDVFSYDMVLASERGFHQYQLRLTVRRSAPSKKFGFEPAKTHSRARMKATREKRRGANAKGRIAILEIGISAQQMVAEENDLKGRKLGCEKEPKVQLDVRRERGGG